MNIFSRQLSGGHLASGDDTRGARRQRPGSAQISSRLVDRGHRHGAARSIEDCRALGVAFALDDFGTGYSSLSYLRASAVAELKIDQSFVRDIVSDADDWAIASAVISLGHSLRLGVIAEGVEHAEQLEMLRRQGCDEVQGYHFSVPLPADEFAELLRQQIFVGRK